jgi:hypothetical protein
MHPTLDIPVEFGSVECFFMDLYCRCVERVFHTTFESPSIHVCVNLWILGGSFDLCSIQFVDFTGIIRLSHITPLLHTIIIPPIVKKGAKSASRNCLSVGRRDPELNCSFHVSRRFGIKSEG